jgi:uncharacterized repeat protein (TIGR03803 family)
MKISMLYCRTLTICVAAAMLGGCGGSQPPVGAPGAISESPAITQRVQRPALSLAPGSSTDGTFPATRLVPVNGTLYGTTNHGGAYCDKKHTLFAGCGTVFSITTSGTETVLHSFGKGSDGSGPSSMIGVDGVLYGTTLGGGVYGKGVVFSITTGGDEHVLYSFRKKPDANYPGGLTNVHGTLYGTSGGGTYNLGTVFSVTKSGVEQVVHSFGQGCGASCGGGSFPQGRLLEVAGQLYGTTGEGGAANEGVVFSMGETGATEALYSFSFGQNGQSVGANGGLIDVDGVLYGTTAAGGTFSEGTIFSVTTSGIGLVLHNFSGDCKRRIDGALPLAPLIDVNGTLYGTTDEGGNPLNCYYYEGTGTVFTVTPSGKVKVVHSFGKGTSAYDGSSPETALTKVHGTLYGTTFEGGPCGWGTVFSITLTGTENVLHSFC